MNNNIFYYEYDRDDSLSIKEFISTFYLAKNKFNYLIDNGLIKVNGIVNKKRDYELYRGDKIEIDVSFYENNDYEPLYYVLDIIYEDDYILVVNKPSGVIMYDLDHKDAPSLARYVSYYYSTKGLNHTIRHVYRLDKDTTGVVIYAKDILTHSYLNYQIENHLVKKEYFALVYGIIEESRYIEKPIGKSRHENNRMIISNNGLPAITSYVPLRHSKRYTLLDVNIKTGRTHQIRVHLSDDKAPIVGDHLYGKHDNFNRVMLECHKMTIKHPKNGKVMCFEIPLDKDINKIIEEDN